MAHFNVTVRRGGRPESSTSSISDLVRGSGTSHRHSKPAFVVQLTAALLSIVVGAYIATEWLGLNAGLGSSSSSSSAVWLHPSPVCTNTCPQARNGVCDEGRQAARGAPSQAVQCDLGTDCDDCGAWTGHLPPAWGGPEGVGPVHYITRVMNETIRAKRTDTLPSFIAAITDAKTDPDVSAMLEGYGAMEGGVTRAMHEIAAAGCLPPGSSSSAGSSASNRGRGLVLDVGANFGYFAVYAALLGCRVIAWEPVPLFAAYLAHAAAVANVSHLITIRSAAAGDAPTGTKVALGVPKHGTYWGLASVENANLHPHEMKYSMSVRSERIDDIVLASEKVLLLKIDVEGWDHRVLQSAFRTLHRTQHVLMEYSPGIAERHKDWGMLAALPRALNNLLGEGDGWAAGHMPMFQVAAPWPPKPMEQWYREPMPALEEVTRGALEADLAAAIKRLHTEVNGSCAPPPPALAKYGPWASCGEWARFISPRGFRSVVGYNTNLWVSRRELAVRGPPPAPPALNASAPLDPWNKALYSGRLRLQGYASLFAPDQAITGPNAEWASKSHPGYGVGLAKCQDIGAGHQVLHRCPCADKSKCGEEEQAALQAARDGLLTYS